jgi:hypothetical protein
MVVITINKQILGGTIVDENVILFSWALAWNLLEGRDHVYFSWFGFQSDCTWVILRILQNQGKKINSGMHDIGLADLHSAFYIK